MPSTLRPLVTPFYEGALTVNRATDPRTVLERLLTPDFRSVNGQETKDRETLVRQLEMFWKLIPDLRWEIRDTLAEGDRLVVRSVATGSPNGPFMGLKTDGSKSFRIDAIDIHRVAGGRIAEIYHVEDWATAMRQLHA